MQRVSSRASRWRWSCWRRRQLTWIYDCLRVEISRMRNPSCTQRTLGSTAGHRLELVDLLRGHINVSRKEGADQQSLRLKGTNRDLITAVDDVDLLDT